MCDHSRMYDMTFCKDAIMCLTESESMSLDTMISVCGGFLVQLLRKVD